MKYILGNAVILTVNDKMDIISGGAVAVENSIIKEVGKTNFLKSKYKDYKFLDYTNSLIMPGLINTHTHLGMSLFRGLAEDLALAEWLEETYKFRKKFVTPEILELGVKLSLLEIIKSGTTTFCDMSIHQRVIAEIVNKYKVRAVLCDTMMKNYYTKEIFSDINYFLEKDYSSALIIKALALHSAYTCDASHFKWLQKMLVKNPDILYTIHLSETENENEMVKEAFGLRPVQVLEKYGLLGEKLLAVHCVWVNDSEIKLFKKNNVKVSYNPDSNLKLASGIAPIVKMLDNGITIGIGTDGAASNNDLDIFSEMDLGAKIQKTAIGNPKVMTARQMARMATIEGAKCLGIDKITGSLEAGKKADIAIINLNQIRLKPIFDIYAAIVFNINGRDVTDVIINGEFIVKNNKITIDDELEILNKINSVNIKINRKIKT